MIVALFGGIGGTIVLLTPGYVMARTFGRGVRSAELAGAAFVAGTAVGGVVIHALFLLWTARMFASTRDAFAAGVAPTDLSLYFGVIAWVVVVMLLAPAIGGAGWAHLTDSRNPRIEAGFAWFGLSTAKRTAEAWIWAFHELERTHAGAHVTVWLKDGSTLTGTLGANALASSDARVRDLYLDQTWKEEDDGNFTDRGKATWISGDQISRLEFEIVPRAAKPEKFAGDEDAQR